MKKFIELVEPIAVKDKGDVIAALKILERVGIQVMSDEQKTAYLEDSTKEVKNNFVIQEDDGGFRIQSHFISTGMSVEKLGQHVDMLFEKHPDLLERIKTFYGLETDIQRLMAQVEDVESFRIGE